MREILRYAWGLLCIVLMVDPSAAQVSPSDEPGRQAQRFEQTAEPLSKPGGMITLPAAAAPAGADAIRLRIAEIRVSGSTVYDEAEFKQVYGALVGQEVALSELYSLAQRITAKYGDDGYVLSRAIVPPQELNPTAAIVDIQVVEGYIDRVEWPPAMDRYRDLFSKYGEHILADRPADMGTVMRYLLLAGDLPGLDVTSRFQASATNPNASTLIVDVTEKLVDAFFQMDNWGTEGRGPWQYSTGMTLNNAFGRHGSLGVTVSGAVETSELLLISSAYRSVLTSEGLFVYANASKSWGQPGTAVLRALAFQSESETVELGVGRPMLRTREKNLTLSGLFFLANSRGQLLGAPNSDDRVRGFRMKAEFDLVDKLNGVTQGDLTVSKGIIALGSTANGNPLASRQNGRVDFATIRGSLSRTQSFKNAISLLAGLDAQYAFTPLLSTEECGYGGKTFGRAFDPPR